MKAIIIKILWITTGLYLAPLFAQNDSLWHMTINDDSVHRKPEVFVSVINLSSIRASEKFYRAPDKKDYHNYKVHKRLITKRPNRRNYDTYYKLAVSLWNLKKDKEAEYMFREIEQSKEEFYTSAYYGDSDVPGGANPYGYGSFKFDYKNKACLFLCKILIERKEYKEALSFLYRADTVYHVYYTCGTGHHFYRKQLIELYGHCFNALKLYQNTIDKSMPHWDFHGTENDYLIEAILKTRSREAVMALLDSAIQSIDYKRDTFMSGNSMNISHLAYITLFGRKLSMNIYTWPQKPDFQVTREDAVMYFKESQFYQKLSGEE